MSLYVYPEVGRTGLCNMLITWARAIIFAREEGATMIAPAWTNFFRIGPWLRREKDKRLYLNQFTNIGYVKGLKRFLIMMFVTRIPEKLYARMNHGVVVFKGHEEGLRLVAKNVELIRDELNKIVNNSYISALESLPTRFIGVHIRVGDFARLGFALDSNYYIRAIERAQELCEPERDVPILIFSDTDPQELAYLSERFRGVRLMPKAPALLDMLSLSKATVLVATNRSTFSAWAAILGGMPSLWDKDGEPPNTFLGLSSYELI